MTNLFHGDRVGKTGFFSQLSLLFPHYFCFENYELGKLPVPLLDLSDLSFGCGHWILPARPFQLTLSLLCLFLLLPSSILSPSSLLPPFPPFLSSVFGDRFPLRGPGWPWTLDPTTQGSGAVITTLHIGFFLVDICANVHRYTKPSIFLENIFFWAITFSFAIQLLPLITC